MNETYVTIVGNVVGQPQARTTRGDVPFVTFRVASNMRRVDFKTGEYIDAGTNFVNVTAFRALGINLANSLKKGEPVIVYGRMRINQWVNGERSGTTVEIDAYNVGHDMTWGQSSFVKVARPQLNQNDRLADPAVQEAQDALDRMVVGAGENGDGENGDGENGGGENGGGENGGGENGVGDDDPVLEVGPGEEDETASAETDVYELVGSGDR